MFCSFTTEGRLTVRKIGKVLRETNDVYREMYAGIAWIWNDVLSPYGKKNALRALGLLVIAMFAMMAVPLTIKEVVDAIHEGDSAHGIAWLIFGTGGVSLFGVLLISVHDHFRELAWNDNYSSVMNSLVRKLFERPLEELLGENNEVGAEQIESAKDRIQNILYLLLMESAQVLTSIIPVVLLMTIVDAIAGMCILALTIWNICWFLYFNTLIDEKMGDIDKDFRRANRRMIEKMYFCFSVKAGGVEEKVGKEIAKEIEKPLMADKAIWAYWFLYIEAVRKVINYTVPILILFYGISVKGWTPGEITAIATWMFLISDKFGFLGHLMRHLTAQVARIKAVRTILASPPAFRYNEGIIYERKD